MYTLDVIFTQVGTQRIRYFLVPAKKNEDMNGFLLPNISVCIEKTNCIQNSNYKTFGTYLDQGRAFIKLVKI